MSNKEECEAKAFEPYVPTKKPHYTLPWFCDVTSGNYEVESPLLPMAQGWFGDLSLKEGKLECPPQDEQEMETEVVLDFSRVNLRVLALKCLKEDFTKLDTYVWKKRPPNPLSKKKAKLNHHEAQVLLPLSLRANSNPLGGGDGDPLSPNPWSLTMVS